MWNGKGVKVSHQNSQEGRRESVGRSATAPGSECIPENIEYLGSGRGALRQKVQALQELRPEFGLAILPAVSGMKRTIFYYHINLLQQDFHAAALNRKWLTNVTVFLLFGQKFFCHRSSTCTLLTWSLIHSLTSRSLDGHFHGGKGNRHSIPRGRTYPVLQSGLAVPAQAPPAAAADNHIRQSMSQKGNCLDNAVWRIPAACSSLNCSICRLSIPSNTSRLN